MFLFPLGLLALIGVPAVVALHLFRRRFQPHLVSAVFLWANKDRTSLAGRKREKLRSSASFWCELLAALFLGLLFAGPRACAAADAQHLVIVLDSTASMSATPASEGDESFRDKALEVVRDRIDGLSSRSRVTIVQSGTPPRIMAGPAAFPAEAAEWLDEFNPRSAQHDLRPAVALGQQLAGEGSVWLVTDRYQPDEYPAEVEIQSIGRSLDNLAIVRATRTRAEDDSKDIAERAFVTVQNFGVGAVRTRLTLASDGQMIDSREIDLAPDERKHLAFDLPSGAPTVEAILDDDALALDNRAVLAPVPPRTLALYSNIPPELSVRLGLCPRTDSKSRIEHLLDIVPDSVESPDSSVAHLILSSDLSAPAGSGTSWNLFVDTGPGEARQDLIGPFLIEKRHPLFRGVTLEGIIWSRNPDFTPAGAPLVSAGDEPLFTEERIGERNVYFCNLDPARSSLQRSPDWPILLSNLAELRREELPGALSTNVLVGEDFVWRGSGEATYRITGEGVDIERATRGTLTVSGLSRVGEYTLEKDGRELARFGLSFADAAESNLKALMPGQRTSQVGLAAIQTGFTWLELAILVGALALILVDWTVLRRAQTISEADLAALEERS